MTKKEILAFLQETVSRNTNTLEYIVLGTKQPGDPKKRYHKFRTNDLDIRVQNFLEKKLDTHEIWFHLGLRDNSLEEYRKGKKTQVSTLHGISFEVDYGNEGHSSTTNPPDLAAALTLVEVLPPDLIVHSGNGIHCHYLFADGGLACNQYNPRDVDAAITAFLKPIHKAAHASGYTGDVNVIGIEREWRLPGSFNRKDPNNPKPVKILERSTPRLTTTDFIDKYLKDAPARGELSIAAPSLTLSEDLDPAYVQRLQDILVESSAGEVFAKVFRAENIVPSGGLHRLALKLTMLLADADNLTHSPEALATMFVPCIEAIINSGKYNLSTVDSLYAEFVRFIETAQERIATDRATKVAEAQAQAEALDRATNEILSETTDRPSPKLFCIRGKSGSHYMWDFRNGGYNPYPQLGTVGALSYVHQAWHCEDSPIEHFVLAGKKVRPKSYMEYMQEYSIQLAELKSSFDLSAPKVTVNGDLDSADLWIPTCKHRVIAPKENPAIHEWLMSLCDPEHPQTQQQFLAWLAAFYDQKQKSAILYMNGIGGSGKTTLVRGLGRMWEQTPVKLSDALKNFNQESLKTPVRYVDEAYQGAERNISAILRNYIAEDKFRIERKGIDAQYIHGHVRVVIAANDGDALASSSNSTLNDAAKMATAERFLLIEPTETAVRIMEYQSQDGRNVERDWVNSNAIAAHVLWLKEQHAQAVLDYPCRFIGGVRQNDDPMEHKKVSLLKQGNEERSQMTEWVEAFLNALIEKDSAPFYGFEDTNCSNIKCLVRDGLWINTKTLKESWESLCKARQLPKASVLSDFLKTVCGPATNKKIGKKQTKLRKVDTGALSEYVDFQILDKEYLQELLDSLDV